MSANSGATNRSSSHNPHQIGGWEPAQLEALLYKENAPPQGRRDQPTAGRPKEATHRKPVVSNVGEHIRGVINLDLRQIRIHRIPTGNEVGSIVDQASIAVTGEVRPNLRSGDYAGYMEALRKVQGVQKKGQQAAQKGVEASQQAQNSGVAEGHRIIQEDQQVQAVLFTHRGIKGLFVANAISASEKTLARIAQKRIRMQKARSNQVHTASKAKSGPGMFGGKGNRQARAAITDNLQETSGGGGNTQRGA